MIIVSLLVYKLFSTDFLGLNLRTTFPVTIAIARKCRLFRCSLWILLYMLQRLLKFYWGSLSHESLRPRQSSCIFHRAFQY